ncbi:hypothetical protein ACNOYE_35940 [Nannocystaceae bacterium ST9]
MRVAIADDFTQLVTHFLAHVPLAGPGNLADPRYVEWAREQLDPSDRATLEHDAALLARLWAADPRLDVLHGLCELHGDLDEFRRTTTRSLAELHNEDVRLPDLLAALRELEGAELVHASLSAMVEGFAKLRVELEGALVLGRERVMPWLGRMRGPVPELGAASIELVWAMGEHGRALWQRILVGSPAAWNRIDPARVAMQAAHEVLVRASEIAEYVEVERWALAELGSRMRDADGELRAAHASWLASLDRSSVLLGT